MNSQAFKSRSRSSLPFQVMQDQLSELKIDLPLVLPGFPSCSQWGCILPDDTLGQRLLKGIADLKGGSSSVLKSCFMAAILKRVATLDIPVNRQ